jgi:hypothetical protein
MVIYFYIFVDLKYFNSDFYFKNNRKTIKKNDAIRKLLI